jgi:hypothetical protein
LSCTGFLPVFAQDKQEAVIENTSDNSAAEESSVPQGKTVYKMNLKKDKDCSQSIYINVEGATAIEELPMEVRAFPNPVSDILFIPLTQKSGEEVIVRLINREGKLLLEKTIKAETSTCQLSMTDYPTGVYFIQTIASQIITQKIIKK